MDLLELSGSILDSFSSHRSRLCHTYREGSSTVSAGDRAESGIAGTEEHGAKILETERKRVGYSVLE